MSHGVSLVLLVKKDGGKLLSFLASELLEVIVLSGDLGCDFFELIHGYENMHKTVRHSIAKVLPLNDAFVYSFCKKGDFFDPIHGYTLQNDHF